MDQNTLIGLLIGLAVVGLIAVIFGRRIGTATLKVLGMEARFTESEQKGPRISRVDSKGARTKMDAQGPDSTIEDIKTTGPDSTFTTRS